MSERPIENAAFRRTRRDHASETSEDYVEAIAALSSDGPCRVADLARYFGVSHVTVSRTVARLVRDGLAESEPRQPVSLTAQGSRVAERCRSRHTAVFDFLRAIGVSDRQAAVDAEGIEHHVSEETLRRLKAVTRKRAAQDES